MADKMPGGTIYEKGTTGYFTEDQAVNLEAMHRQIGAQSSAALDALKTKADVSALAAVRDTAVAAQSTAQSAQSSASAAVATAGAARDTATNADARVTALESVAGFGPSTPVDGQTASLVLQPGTQTRAAAASLVDERTTVRSLESFGTVGDGTADDAPALTAALSWAAGRPGRRIVGSPSAAYAVRSTMTLPAGAIHMDLSGAELRFENGGGLTSATPTPYLTTNVPAGITRRGTKFTASSVAGVAVGDLVQIDAPSLVWAGQGATVTLKHTYVVADVDAATGDVWVEGRIVGDITPAQISAAGKTGGVVARFYRLVPSLTLANTTLSSPSRTGASTLVSIKGYHRVRLENVTVTRPVRAGISTDLCGLVETVGCVATEHGYTTRDRGYASLSSDPDGLAFGYGFLVTNTWVARTRGCTSLSGWHGWDFAVGTSYALVSDHLASKDAYGISTHEGCTVLDVHASRFLGGHAITSRSSELYVRGCKIDSSLNPAISGHGQHHRVVLADLDIDVASPSGPAAPFSISNALYGDFMFSSSDRSFLKVHNVQAAGVSAGSGLQSRGDLDLKNVTVDAARDLAPVDTSITCSSTANGALARVTDVEFLRLGEQFGVTLNAFSRVEATNVTLSGAPGGTNSALLTVGSMKGPAEVVLSGVSAGQANYALRVTAGPAVMTFHNCSAPSGALSLAVSPGSGQRVRQAVHCRFKSVVTVGGAPVDFESGNVTLPA